MSAQDERLIEALAAVWYAHDVGTTLELARENIAKYRNAEHSGNCHMLACARCYADDALQAGRELRDAINASGVGWIAPGQAGVSKTGE